MRTRAGAWLVAAGVALLATPLPAKAILWESLRGYMDVTAVQTQVAEEEESTLRQEYTLNLSRTLSPYVLVRSSVRFYRFDLEQFQADDSFREELQPMGELLWTHPGFHFASSGSRRIARGAVGVGELITDNLQLSLRSRRQDWPTMSLRYDWQHIFDREGLAGRETRDGRLQATAEKTLEHDAFTYSFTRRDSENIISGLESTQNNHIFRWAGAREYLDDEQLRVSSNYTFSHSSQTDRPRGDLFLETIPIAQALYGLDASPDVGPLDPLGGLRDGNTSAVTDPAIDIGGAQPDHNLGADLGFERPVSAMYVYTDRLSGENVSWRVYRSDDNLNWRPLAPSPAVSRNAALNRYEIVFDTVSTRYLKVVNEGLNEIASVFVTELLLLEQVEDAPDEIQRDRTSHLADLRATLPLSESVDVSADVAYQYEPGQGSVGSRHRSDYVLRTNYLQNPVVSHNLKWEQSFQRFENSMPQVNVLPNLRDDSATYTLLVDPLDTLTGTLSTGTRQSYQGGDRSEALYNALASVSGSPIYRVSATAEVGRSRTLLFDRDIRNDVWTYRAQIDGPVTRSLDAILSWTLQQTTTMPDDDTRWRRLYGIGFNYRVTRTIFARGRVDILEDVRSTTIQDYLVSWNPSPKLSLSGQYRSQSADDGFLSERYGAGATFDLNSRTDIYVRYYVADEAQAGGDERISFQQGLRASF